MFIGAAPLRHDVTTSTGSPAHGSRSRTVARDRRSDIGADIGVGLRCYRPLTLPRGGRSMDAIQTLIEALVVAFATTVLAWMVGGLRRETRESIGRLRGEVGLFRDDLAAT
ncbi:MAG TPA: hypothetical protein VE646_04555 [Actinomycetota bacterium]|nr:hypothetical protein [Actinomycetota bacterium]